MRRQNSASTRASRGTICVTMRGPSRSLGADATISRGAIGSRVKSSARGDVSRLPVTAGSTPYPARGRYHLYISLACPWRAAAHRAQSPRLAGRHRRTVSIRFREERGWAFATARLLKDPDQRLLLPQRSLRRHRSALHAAAPSRVWGPAGEAHRNNSEATNTGRMLSDALRARRSLFPADLAGEQRVSRFIYGTENGVYRAGFRFQPAAYEAAPAPPLFAALESSKRASPTALPLRPANVESEWRLAAPRRFAAVSHGHSSANVRHRIPRLPPLHGLPPRPIPEPRNREAREPRHITRGTIRHDDAINTTRIRPLGRRWTSRGDGRGRKRL